MNKQTLSPSPDSWPSPIKDLYDRLPEIVARRSVPALTGGMIAAGSLANLDSTGDGPAETLHMGARKVGYSRHALCQWLASRITVQPRKARRVPEGE